MDWQAALSFWQWANSQMGEYHLYAAAAALVIGPLVFLMRKGDILHRLMGLAYVFAMLTTNISALTMYTFSGGPNFFHASAVFSLTTVLVGLVAIIFYAGTKSKAALDLHLQMMSWSYFGLVIAAVAEAATRGLPRLFENFENFWTPFFVIVVTTSIVGSILVVRLLRPVRRRWILEG